MFETGDPKTIPERKIKEPFRIPLLPGMYVNILYKLINPFQFLLGRDLLKQCDDLFVGTHVYHSPSWYSDYIPIP